MLGRAGDYRNQIDEKWEEYYKLIKECENKRSAVRAAIDEMLPIVDHPTMETLISFCESKEVKQGKSRKLWLKYGNQLKPRNALSLTKNKAVFEVGSKDLMTP